MSIKNTRGGLQQSEASIVVKNGAATQLTITHPAANTSARTLSLPNQDYDYSLPAVKHSGDTTKAVVIDTSGATTAKTMTFVSSQTDNRSLTLPDATDTLVGRATTDTLTNKTLTAPTITGAASVTASTLKVNDTSADHTYTFGVSELTADRVVTLPLLTGNDEFTFNAHAQTLTNKTLTAPKITDAGTYDLIITSSNGSLNTADRTISINCFDGDRTLNFASNLSVSSGLVSLVGDAGGSIINLPAGTTNMATTQGTLAQFAATTSAELAGVISNETGSGALVFGTSPTITTPSGIVKGDVGLGNVDNTSDATKNAASVTLTNKTLTAPVITTNGSIDVDGVGTLTIGASMGANDLTLGGATSNIVITGSADIATLDVTNSESLTVNTIPVVTVSGNAELTNKTFTGGAVNGADIDGETASNDKRITIPKNTKANLDALTRKEATVVYATDQSKLYVDDGSVLAELGGGGAGKFNYIANPSAETDATSDVTGTGGPSATRGTTAATFASNYFVIVGFDGAGDEFEWSTDTLQAYHDNILFQWSISAKLNLTGSGTYTVGLWDGTAWVGDTATLIDGSVVNASGSFVFDSSNTYTIRIVSDASANALDEILVKDVTITNEGSVTGEVSQQEVAYTPSNTQGFGTISNNNLEYSRSANHLYIRGNFTAGTVDGNEAQLELPDSLTVGGASGVKSICGTMAKSSASADFYHLLVTEGDTYLNFGEVNSAGSGNGTNPLSGTQISTSSDIIYIDSGPIPIAEWSGQQNIGENKVEYAYNTSTSTTTSDTTSFAIGSQGAQIQALTAQLARRVRFSSTIKPTDSFMVEVSDDREQWMPLEGGYKNTAATAGIQPWTLQNANTYGMGRLVQVNSTDIDVEFGTYCLPTGATYGAAGTNWAVAGNIYWRVKKFSDGTPVGFGLATATQAGLVERYQTETVAANGSMSGANFVCTRVGNVVTITADATITHSSSALVTSSAGLIPADFRPSDVAVNIYYVDGSYIAYVDIQTDGTVRLIYRDWTGATSARVNGLEVPSISYVVT
jgi:hypothetical protein